MNKIRFSDNVLSLKREVLTALELKIIQVNLGYCCNMACKHCHVQGGPMRTEVMDKQTMKQVLRVIRDNPVETLDITGGAPEMNPCFRWLVQESKKTNRHIIVRTNLTIFHEDGMEDLAEFYKEHEVELIASLPYYLEDGVERVRGRGAYKKSIDALQKLNALGYGESSGLSLNLVYNPSGAFLAPLQSSLEAEYKHKLKEQFNISFTHLYTFTNMPIGRFKSFLERTGKADTYMEKLETAFNPVTLDSIMCRYMVNVGWDGKLYDCDFNQALGVAVASRVSDSIESFDFQSLVHRQISVDDHCYGCTAGQGST